MTLDQFDNGYWYIDQIKDFAKKIGMKSASKLRKDQLERLIRHFIQTGELKNEATVLPAELRASIDIEKYSKLVYDPLKDAGMSGNKGIRVPTGYK